MSKQNNLTDFLTDVANAIRAKKGSTDLINPQDFSSEIASLPSGLEIVDMTETTATIEPNKVYVWGMVESLNITLGASTDESDFFAFRFRCSKPTMTVVTVNGATWAEDTELDAEGKPVLDLGSWYQCEIKGGTSALYVRLAHYIPFADSSVEAVLLANGVGDGLGVTYKDAAKVKSISTWFYQNADITSFSEFVNFSGISILASNAFNGCSSLAEISLPASLTSTGEYAFYSCSSLAEITLPTSLTSIGYTAFARCTSLAGITLPASLTSIESYAFAYCSSLAEITLPASLTSIGGNAFQNCSSLARVLNLENTKVTSIGSQSFQDCSLLTEIALPDTLTSIWDSAFEDCSSLAEINLPDTLTDIGRNAFRNCSSLARVLNLENTKVTSIRFAVFIRCTALAEIALPDTLTDIENYAFYGCTVLAEITLPASLTSIGNYAFQNCSSLARVLNLENTKVTSIREKAFYSCSSLAEITLPTSLTSIGYAAFARCTSLAGITLPASLTSIENYAFQNCSSLQYIRIEATTPPTLESEAIPSTIGAIYVPDESVAAYQAATNWSSFASKIKGISEMPA